MDRFRAVLVRFGTGVLARSGVAQRSPVLGAVEAAAAASPRCLAALGSLDCTCARGCAGLVPELGAQARSKELRMLRIYDDALQIVRRLVPYVEQIRRRQPSLADQLDRAGDSTVLGIAEGSRSAGKTRALHYTRGAASMDEAIGCIDLALAKGHIAAFEEDLRQAMKRVVGTLIKAKRA